MGGDGVLARGTLSAWPSVKAYAEGRPRNGGGERRGGRSGRRRGRVREIGAVAVQQVLDGRNLDAQELTVREALRYAAPCRPTPPARLTGIAGAC